eukprot:8759723-Pyramimonas_sp.AAC.1
MPVFAETSPPTLNARRRRSGRQQEQGDNPTDKDIRIVREGGMKYRGRGREGEEDREREG